ncbi:lithostathine-2-like isoform X2 [Kryptolebias marmoratus]|uniref:lithostathine-2-like isoform X2 n=1 Tax=Kryptolebias marmoratus TaxID=37003 RepID=UPI000D530357|nr:lithostathine-2-like isoform X2 [Kryptolebias marmoratus]
MQWSLILLFLMGQCCFITCLYEYHYVGENKTWSEAQQYCREKYTDLATVSNMTDMKRILNKSAGNMNEAWIGLYDQTDGNRTWHWSLPGVEFKESETNWSQGEPTDKGTGTGTTENCGMIKKDLTWGDYSCPPIRSFLCYDDKVILIKENKTWEEALYYCRVHHHDLVSITNLDEQRWVQEEAMKASTPFVWMGLHYTCALDFWFWVSSEEVSYKNWVSDGQMDDCDMSGAMETGGQHKWFKKNHDEKFNFICSKH